MQLELSEEQAKSFYNIFMFNYQKTMFCLKRAGYSKYVCKNFEGGGRDD